LAEKVGALRGSLVNHLVGLPITILLAAASLRRAGDPFNIEFPIRPWIFLGGVLGVTVVLLCNLTVSHISAFRLTLLTFIGQVFTGIWLDLSAGNGYSDVTFRSGLIIAGGVILSRLTEWVTAKRFKQRSVS
jgi:transporter family-2 protein